MKPNYTALTIIWAVLLTILLLMPGDNIPEQDFLPGFDKLVHVGIFGIFSFLFVNTIKKSGKHRIQRSKLIFSFFVTFLYSVALEYCQRFVPGRSFDISDLLANGIGIIVGLFLFAIIYKF